MTLGNDRTFRAGSEPVEGAMRYRSLASCVSVMVFAMGLIGLPSAIAEDPQPKPEAEAVKTKRPKTLADLAGGIKLQQPDGEEKKEGVVIDNANLKAMGEGAVISEGKGLAGTAATGSLMPGPGGEEVPSDADLDKARQDIELLQAQLEAIGKATEENKKANLYNGAGPQYRAPGVTDPLDNQRQDLEQKLEEAQGAFNAMEKQKAAADRKNSPQPGAQQIPAPKKRKPVTR